MKTKEAIICGALLVITSGCAHMPINHPDPKVGVPAEIGGMVGMVIGIPLDIVALPVTIPLAMRAGGEDERSAYIIGAPSIATGYVVGNVVGFVPWLIWGWWGNEKYETPLPSPVTPTVAYTPEVRKMSHTDDTVFRNLLNAVETTDRDRAPNTRERTIAKIDVFVPYDSEKTGLERWTITRDGKDAVSYIVKLIPDGHGGTFLDVGKDDGKALRNIPILPTPLK